MFFRRTIYLATLVCFFTISNIYPAFNQSEKFKGLTVVGSQRAYQGDPFEEISKLGSNFISLVPYGFCRDEGTQIRYNLDRQWWGEKEVGVIESIRMAKAKGIKIMLKPQVFMHAKWVGEYDLKTEKDWLEWEKSYRAYILFFAKIAAENDVELFCIGTEYKVAVQKREKFWRQLIDEIRSIYCGLLTYSSNWDAYDKVPFWDALDLVGLSAYFPLSNRETPEINDLLKTWQPIDNKLEQFSKKHGKKILFTEYGYLSVDGCAGKTWELEENIRNRNKNQTAQAIALDALYQTFWNKSYWQGGFMWKWFPEMMGHEGYPERDYTPQGKLAIEVIKKQFAQNRP